MKMAIFGGAFNPVHREHVNLAHAAVKELGLDKLIIMPTAVSPHKSGKLSADFWQRFEMCRLAFSSVPQAEVSNYELTRGGISYTYLTCNHFAKLYPDAEKYFIIGADMLENFPLWKNPEIVLKNFTLAACAREDLSSFSDYKRAVEERFNTRVAAFSYVGESVSSTEIRTLAALGEDFSEYVNAEVCQYVKEKDIYALKPLWKVKDMLKKERWEHTVRVAVMCAKNAGRARLTEEQAIVMATLHDCAKYLSADSAYLKGFEPPAGVPDAVMHQFSGAYVAGHTFGAGEELADAIRYHTTGKENMSDAGILLFLCDMLEPGRSFPGVDKLRALFEKDIRKCLAAALSRQVEYLSSSGMPVDGTTLKAYKYYSGENK